MFRTAIFFLVLISAPAVWSEIIVVSPEGPETIQEAIDQAQSGDVVELLDGVFRGPGNRDLTTRGKAITVRSRSGDPTACIIDCEGDPGARRGFHIFQGETPATVIEGLTVENGFQSWGAGIYCEQAQPTIRNCRFIGNRATADGGGLAASRPIEVTDCLFALNVAYNGGGAEVADSWDEPARFERCTFIGNLAVGYGGGFRT